MHASGEIISLFCPFDTLATRDMTFLRKYKMEEQLSLVSEHIG